MRTLFYFEEVLAHSQNLKTGISTYRKDEKFRHICMIKFATDLSREKGAEDRPFQPTRLEMHKFGYRFSVWIWYPKDFQKRVLWGTLFLFAVSTQHFLAFIIPIHQKLS